MKKLIALLLALVMALSLAACGNGDSANDQPDEVTNSANVPADGTESPEPSEELNNKVVEYYMQKADEVVVTDTHVTFIDDGSGKEVSIEKGPKNVAVLYGSLACLWYEAGGTIQLAVGGKSATDLYIEQIGHDFTQDEGVTVVTESSSGTSWDVETIIAAKPDLIVTSVGMKGYETISGPAGSANIPVIGINYDAVQDYLKWFKVFCNLNNQPELWDQIAEATANEIIDIVSKVPENVEAPRVLTLLISSDTLKAYTHDSQSGVMINELGGVNVVDEDGTSTASSIDISLEDIYALDPDIIFYSERAAAGVDVLMDLVGDSPVWQSLRAVQKDHMYVLEKGLFFNKANKRYNESYRTMAGYLYPDFDFGGTVNTAAKLALTEENGLLTCFDAETSPFEDCAVRVTVDQSAKTVTFTKATADGKDTQEYYCFMPEEHMMEQFYYVSMMGTGFYYYYDTELGEMVRMENMNHEDTTASAKENGRFDGPAERIKGDAAALERYFEESFGMTIAEAVQ